MPFYEKYRKKIHLFVRSLAYLQKKQYLCSGFWNNVYYDKKKSSHNRTYKTIVRRTESYGIKSKFTCLPSKGGYS